MYGKTSRTSLGKRGVQLSNECDGLREWSRDRTRR